MTYSLAETDGILTAQFTQMIVFRALEMPDPSTNSMVSNITATETPTESPYA